MQTVIAVTDTPQSLDDAVARAAELLARGEVVALPTETVYGLAADATQPDAVLKIFEAKERPFFDPLIVHLPTLDWLDRIAFVEQPLVKVLVEKFWPGPLTIVLPGRKIVPDIVTSGLDTVAVRMSAHPVFQTAIKHFGKPLAAPSANRFGRISPTAAEHVFSELNGRIPLIVDGGETSFGIESTIISVAENEITILRSGPITPEQLGEFGVVNFARPNEEKPEAPGQLKSHYAPRTPLELCEKSSLQSALSSRAERKGFLAWQMPPEGIGNEPVEVLSLVGDLREAAATLFAKMRRLDEAGLDVIYAEPVPETGLGIAIMDRLRRAAAR